MPGKNVETMVLSRESQEASCTGTLQLSLSNSQPAELEDSGTR